YGVEPDSAITELNELLGLAQCQDTYTKSSLYLELARQLTLRGRILESQEALDQVCELIHASRHRRYQTILNLRYAHNQYLTGENHQALNLLSAALLTIDRSVDNVLHLEALGLKARVLEQLRRTSEREDVDAQVRRLAQYTGSGIARRIAARM